MSTQDSSIHRREATPGRPSRGTGFREWAYGLAALLPLLLLTALFIVGEVRERAAAADVRAELSRLKSEGYPVGIRSMTQWYDARTAAEHAQQWQDVLAAYRAVQDRFDGLAEGSVEGFDRVVAPDQSWSAKPIAQRYVEESKPIIDAIERLVGEEQPVWFPIVFEGYGTVLPDLQAYRELVRLLAVELAVAVHQGDDERAIRALGSIPGVAAAFDSQVALVADLVHMALVGQHRSLIRQSLAVGFWTDTSQLIRLRQQLPPLQHLDRRWQRAIAAERALGLELLDAGSGGWRDSGLFPFPWEPAPIVTRRYLQVMRAIGQLSHAGTVQHGRRVDEILNEMFQTAPPSSSISISGIPFASANVVLGEIIPAYQGAATAFARLARERRWTLTAVAIKQYQLQQNRWPSELAELTAVGLLPSDWQAFDSVPFGYEVSSDGDEAVLWTMPVNGEVLPPEPPTEQTEYTQDLETFVVHIR